MNLNERISTYLKAKQAYYFGTAIMSDAQFDKLEEDIRNVAPDHPALAIVGAPLPPPSGGLAKATHSMPMGSQEKVHTWDELVRWKSLRDESDDFHVSLKADGCSIGTYYKSGRLNQGITRGQKGTEGEDITAHAMLFQHLPAELPDPFTVSVRCEAVLTLDDWKKADPDLESNPRALTGGLIGRLDSKEAHLLTALAFDIQEDGNTASAYGLDLTTETGKCKALETLGFKCAPWKGGLTLDQVKEFYEEIKAKRDANQLPFWIDGIVVKYDSIDIQNELGSASGKPKGQTAWKFPPEGAWTTLLEVFWQVGHTGAITPVAIVEPVRIGGTTVSRASLANAENIKLLGAYIGAKVYVIKAGDIIPQITEVKGEFDAALGHEKIETPTACPTCGGKVAAQQNVSGTDSVVHFCTNPDCESKTLGKIKRFCTSRDILGIGDSIIETLVTSKRVAIVPDLYRLDPDDMESLIINTDKGVRLGRKRAEAICAEIEAKARKMSLAEFLGAFGTRSLGVRRATLMIAANPELENVERWFDGSLVDGKFAAAAGVPKMGAVIFAGLQASESTIRETLKEITLSAPVATPQAAPGGKTFCITGSLPSGKKKKEYAPELAAIGCLLADDLTKDVNFLVLSDPNGPESSKTKKAKKLGIPLMSEEDLAAFIKEKAGDGQNAAPTAPTAEQSVLATFLSGTKK